MSKSKILNLIVAHDINKGISRNGEIPWKHMQDMKFFRNTTSRVCNISKSNALIMGSGTFEKFIKFNTSSNRLIYVVTRNPQKYRNIVIPGLKIVSSVDSAIQLATSDSKIEEIFACSNIVYTHVLKHELVDKLYVTYIKEDHQCDNFIRDYSHLNICQKARIYTDDKISINEYFVNPIYHTVHKKLAISIHFYNNDTYFINMCHYIKIYYL